MVKLPQDILHPTVDAIDTYHEHVDDGGNRTHLGASVIGRECSRQIWYMFRWARKASFPGRVKRLFRRGHNEEHTMNDDLRAIGVTVHDVDPETGDQFRISAHGGHFGGSMDSALLGLVEAPKTWHVGEYKTHNDKSFKALVKDKVRVSKPEHYAQMQIYMHYTGMTRAYYLAVNKNDDTYYSERIEYDPVEAARLVAKAERIIFSDSPPDRAFGPDWFACKWCDFRDICHDAGLPERNCRTCVHVTAQRDGTWSCAEGKDMGDQRQALPCQRINWTMTNHKPEEVIDGNPAYLTWTDRGPEDVNS